MTGLDARARAAGLGGGARRWTLLVGSLVAVPVGAVLALRPFVSLAVLVVGVAVGLVVLGVVRLVTGRPAADGATADVVPSRWWWLAGVAYLAAALVVVLWPGPTIRVLAVAVGAVLVLDGVLDVLAAQRASGSGRAGALLSGATSLLLGALALAWPDVTVLVVAVLVGVSVLFAGLRGVAAAVRGRGPHRPTRWERRARPGARRVAGEVAALVVTLALVAVGIGIDRGTHQPDDFYAAPADVPDEPGRLLRSEPFASTEVPADATAWRILYTTTREDGTPTVASGLVVAPRAATGADARPADVVAWAHGTTGVTPGCAPSVLPDGLAAGAMFVLDDVLAQGWALVATDYAGLGTDGPHAYLVGRAAAYDVLDAVRAAHELDDVALSDRNVAWGHSQGGGAALWTGIVGPQYAPDVELLGVAALAPASNPSALLAHLPEVSVGALFAAYLAQGYATTYPDVRLDEVVRPGARVIVQEMAQRCLAERGVVVSALTALLLDQPVWEHADPYTGAFGERLDQNVPSGPIPAPLLVAQGTADSIVVASSQDEYVDERCSAGYAVDHRSYAGLDHVALVEADSPLVPDLLAWTHERFAGEPPADSCP
ncbi:lipase family protein [Cellulomonas xiejunii]|uniref:DUF308 domain-containing protein n=1 Tax=Cellulomonas xiejunii TaxID=2968083 RepID=A0ABY5KNR8_9CELL|nr:lipase family protein [Cellulomonas xiejunii]MCC2321429.1 DUF308 domain-containing protein [Cellulomonas xiejunii]MCC2323419.1 DUF308 domain-containing protein [Cellulomonas xiejunii]UUI72005.1 DUF308 domain-containing protein [Cellulomonas xiejunii]